LLLRLRCAAAGAAPSCGWWLAWPSCACVCACCAGAAPLAGAVRGATRARAWLTSRSNCGRRRSRRNRPACVVWPCSCQRSCARCGLCACCVASVRARGRTHRPPRSLAGTAALQAAQPQPPPWPRSAAQCAGTIAERACTNARLYLRGGTCPAPSAERRGRPRQPQPPAAAGPWRPAQTARGRAPAHCPVLGGDGVCVPTARTMLPILCVCRGSVPRAATLSHPAATHAAAQHTLSLSHTHTHTRHHAPAPRPASRQAGSLL
jgi:hypothetical protein